ncbi:lipoyl(octanoyl) transferase LipB [Nitrosophilus kaiyonis]|uniref:lipoyl(octanoyl) transferase LipB n=1 Tax=Nitrosophilus kaiyonis TaxID=2930200 RepID=UPI0024931F7D|nr:lipoyl(octanoyl) transferase LipB [Nitrosophilus kaiyonis]
MKIVDLDLIEYKKALNLMDKYIDDVEKNRENILFFCRHYPVYTVGSDKIDIDVDVLKTDRGGSITYHDEGTLMVYFIFKINSPALFYKKVVKSFKKFFEKVDKNIFYDYKRPGFYIENRKIASLGFRYKKGISKHGVAIHINSNLENFNKIKPCNLEGVVATSFRKENIHITFEEVKKELIEIIKYEFSKA